MLEDDCYSTAKTSWLFYPQSGYPGFRQIGEAVVTGGLFGIEDYLHKATQETAAQFILQPQYTDNPQNICEGITCLHIRAQKFL